MMIMKKGRKGRCSDSKKRNPPDAFVRSHTCTTNSMKDEELPSKFSSERKTRRWNS